MLKKSDWKNLFENIKIDPHKVEIEKDGITYVIQAKINVIGGSLVEPIVRLYERI